jgi:hypothetical protein
VEGDLRATSGEGIAGDGQGDGAVALLGDGVSQSTSL